MVVSYLRSIFLKSKMRNTRSTQHQADEECCEHQESGSHRTTELFNVLLTQNPADETDLNNNHELSTLSSIPDNSTIEYPSSFVYSDQTVSSRHISSVPPLIESDALLSDNPTVVRNTVSRFGSTFSTRLMVSMTIAVSIAVFIVITTVALGAWN